MSMRSHQQRPLRRVIESSIVGAERWERIECGHFAKRRAVDMLSDRRRCKVCPRGAA